MLDYELPPNSHQFLHKDKFEVLYNYSMDKPRKDKLTESMKLKEEVYVPSWRAACDAWVSKNVEDKPGVHTPVFQLYNAFIRDNPNDYMDIGQFGKVLRSRFPYRKRRRGKQGQQVYVYQDVALKSELTLEETQEKSLSPNEIGSARALTPPSTTQAMSIAGPSILVGNNTGGWLVSSHLDLETLESSRASPVKRESDDSDRNTSSPAKKHKPSSHEGSSNSPDSHIDQEHKMSGDEKYSNANLCRMAIGRRWIDANLIDMPGQHTYANDVFKAYNEDHPNEPLTFTSLALLIRGKFPGRRKKVTRGSEAKYIYKNLKLRVPNERVTSKSHGNELMGSNKPALNVSHESFMPSSPNQLGQTVMESSISTVTPVASMTLPVLSTGYSDQTLQLDSVRPQQSTIYVPITSVSVAGASDISWGKPIVVQAKENTARNFPKYAKQDKGKKLLRRQKTSVPFMPEVSKSGTQILQDGEKSAKDAHMNVSQYLEEELLDINDLKKIGPNYQVSIQVPSGIQDCEFSESLDFMHKTKVNAHTNKTDLKDIPMQKKHPRYKQFSNEESKTRVEVNTSLNNQIGDHCEMPLSSQSIPVFVSDMSHPLQSWDYKLRQSVSPEIPSNWMARSPKTEEFELPVNLTCKVNDSKRSLENEAFSPASNMHSYSDAISVSGNVNSDPSSSINSSMNNMSLAEDRYEIVSGSPTSSSPPGAAMHRLEDEIETSQPYILDLSKHAETSYQSACGSVEEQDTLNYSEAAADNHFKALLKSVVSTGNKILTARGEPTSEIAYERNIEKALIKNNPAVFYDDSLATNSFPCSVGPALKELELSSPEQIINLITHHQSCAGLGCTNGCRTLRAAYIHIALFNHKCDVWNSFYRIMAKHSKRCRKISCGVEFCHFIKHELHLNGISVLPMQLFKERSAVEEEFRKCEEFGPHSGDLHCHHLPSPKLPIVSFPSKESIIKKHTEGLNVSENEDCHLGLLCRAIIPSYPDTQVGNIVAFLVAKTANLLRELFKRNMDIR